MLNAILLQIFQNKMKRFPKLPPVSPTEHLQILKKICFICNDKRIIDNNTYNKGGFGRCGMDFAKEHLNEGSKY